jgi:hypothetical protein
MERKLIGMCQNSHEPGHSCDDCELTLSFNDLQKWHKKYERKYEKPKKKEKKRTNFKGRSCVKCWIHKTELVHLTQTHKKSCEFRSRCDSTGFCQTCTLHEKYKKALSKFNQMRKRQIAEQQAEAMEVDHDASRPSTSGGDSNETGTINNTEELVQPSDYDMTSDVPREINTSEAPNQVPNTSGDISDFTLKEFTTSLEG